jgi:hypothetical protein
MVELIVVYVATMYVVIVGQVLVVRDFVLNVPNDFRAGLSGTPLFTTLKFRRHPTTYSTTQNVNCIVIPLIK